MNHFRRILKQKCGSRSHMRVANTHNKLQAPRTLRTEVTSRIVSGTNKTKNKFFSSNFFSKFWWSAPHEGVTMHKKFQPSRTPRTQATGIWKSLETHHVEAATCVRAATATPAATMSQIAFGIVSSRFFEASFFLKKGESLSE